MSDLSVDKPIGLLRRGWSAAVDDYAIAGGWTLGGEALVVADVAGGLCTFEGKSGKPVWAEQDTHDGGVLDLAIRPDGGEFATAGQDGRVVVWRSAEGKIERSLDVGKGWVDNVAWSPDGQWLAASCSRQVCVYDADGRVVWSSDDHPSTISAIAWSSTGELATACYGQVAFFDVATGDLRQKLEWKGSLVSMVLSPDGDVVACGSQDNSVHFWRRSTGQDSMMGGYPAKPSALSFDDTGELLATGGGDTVLVWSFAEEGPEGTEPGYLEVHDHLITALAWACRGRCLASGGRDCIVALWSLKRDGKGDPIGGALLNDMVSDLYWRPDGRALVALDAQGGVTAWRVGNR
jgi:WD40 repeat protein